MRQFTRRNYPKIICVALAAILCAFWALGDTLYQGGRPIRYLDAAAQNTLDDINAEFHNVERWFGEAAAVSLPTNAGDTDSMTPFDAVAGSDDWGDWIQVIGSADTPVIAGKTEFDIHRVEITSVDTAALTRMQIGWNATTTTAIISSNSYTEFPFFPSGVGANVSAPPFRILMPDQVAGTLVWARVWVAGQNGDTISFLAGVHEF